MGCRKSSGGMLCSQLPKSSSLLVLLILLPWTPVWILKLAGINYVSVSYVDISYEGVSYEGVSYAGVSYEGISYAGVSYEGVSYAGASRKKWHIVSEQSVQNSSNEEIEGSRLGQLGERLTYEMWFGPFLSGFSPHCSELHLADEVTMALGEGSPRASGKVTMKDLLVAIMSVKHDVISQCESLKKEWKLRLGRRTWIKKESYVRLLSHGLNRMRVHKLMLLKENLKKTSHKHKFEGLDEFLFKYSKVNKDFIQRRNLTKLLWADGYFVPRRKAYNPMERRKEFPTKRVPTNRQKDQTYWSKLMHGRKGSCKASMEDKRTNSRCCFQVMYLPPPIPSDPWRHDDILLILNRPLRMIEIMPHHGSISVFMNPLWCLPLVFELKSICCFGKSPWWAPDLQLHHPVLQVGLGISIPSPCSSGRRAPEF
ncbi:hypothetical protein BC332_08157 [Capsicum chinense]|nr:hypothetical protein BC332_08157 [Capsicum chinense]